MTISVQGIDLIVPKEYGKIANLGDQMLMKKNCITTSTICINYSLQGLE